MAELVQLANRISVGVQFLTGIAGFYGLSLPVPREDAILKDVLGLEMIVQVIEFVFYLGFLSVFNIATLTQSRYFDWFISTPVMLFTTSLFFVYENAKAAGTRTPESWRTFLAANVPQIAAIVVLNFLMLLFGYLAEIGVMNRMAAFWLGTLALIGSFSVIYINYVDSELTQILFTFLSIIWMSYGFAFLQGPVIKNLSYTVLDIVAKNFFGVYLTWKIWRSHSDTKASQKDAGRFISPPP
jgi:bacteriorhodopsin